MREIKTSLFMETIIAFAAFFIITGLLLAKILLAINETYAQVANF